MHYKVTPVVASPKEQLYEQVTSNPAFTEINIKKTQRLSPRFSFGAKIFGHVSHSTELVRILPNWYVISLSIL